MTEKIKGMNRIDALEQALAGIMQIVHSMASPDVQEQIAEIMNEWEGL